MKKIVALLSLIVCCIAARSQQTPLATPYAVPIDTITKLIAYEEVVDVKGASPDELYKRMDEWFHTYYKNPTEAIRENDSLKFSIVAKPRFRLSNTSAKDGSKIEGTIVQYTITVAARPGRFKYEITEFNWKQLSYYPCERWLDTKASSYLPVYNDYLQQLDKTALDIVSSLKNAMTHEKAVKDKDKW